MLPFDCVSVDRPGPTILHLRRRHRTQMGGHEGVERGPVRGLSKDSCPRWTGLRRGSLGIDRALAGSLTTAPKV